MKLRILTILILATSLATMAQEFRCRVNISTKEQQESDRELYNNLKKNIEEFMNNQVWTDNVFDPKERIELNIAITIKGRAGDVFDATFQIQSNRTAFNSSYNSMILNILDEYCKFKYQEFETLEFDENTFNSNLTYVLAFYAYTVLGLDYDSYSLNGGSKWFQNAEALVNNAQSQNDYYGWKAFEKKDNRYWLIENIQNPAYSSYRKCMYTYHRLGLDVMTDKPADGRGKVAEALVELEKVNKQKPGLFIITLFFQSKSKEIQDIFSEGQPDEKSRVLALLKKMDPARGPEYDRSINRK